MRFRPQSSRPHQAKAQTPNNPPQSHTVFAIFLYLFSCPPSPANKTFLAASPNARCASLPAASESTPPLPEARITPPSAPIGWAATHIRVFPPALVSGLRI